MTIVRWEPLRELGTLQTEMNRLFNTAFDSPGQGNGGALRRWMPAMDLVETDRPLRPPRRPAGHERGGRQDRARGHHADRLRRAQVRARVRSEGYYRVERAFGSFARTLTLPKGVDPEAVTASFDRGVLEIRVPKPEARKPRRIEIGGARPPDDRGLRTRRPGRAVAPPRIPTRGDG